MAHFETDAEVYEQLGQIFKNLLGNTERLAQLRQVDAVVQYAFTAPEATVTCDVRARKDPRVDLGDTKLRPDIVLAMEADIGRALLLGELNPTLALARGAVQAKGPVNKILLLVPATVAVGDVEADAPLPEPADEPVATEAPASPDAEVATADVEAAPADEAPAEPDTDAAPPEPAEDPEPAEVAPAETATEPAGDGAPAEA